MQGVDTTVCDMCAYGLKVEDARGVAPAEKSTKLMSNSPGVLKRCSRGAPTRLSIRQKDIIDMLI